jgi:GH18 family chitinase
MYKDRQWLNYEDERSVTLIAQWIRQQGLAGAMVFDLHSDDWSGSCGFDRFPLIKAINRTLFSSATDQSTTTASIPQ